MATSLIAFFAVSGRKFSPVTVIGKRIQTRIDLKNNISALAAVAPVRTSRSHKFFPPEADMAIAALAGTQYDFSTICKHVSSS